MQAGRSAAADRGDGSGPCLQIDDQLGVETGLAAFFLEKVEPQHHRFAALHRVVQFVRERGGRTLTRVGHDDVVVGKEQLRRKDTAIHYDIDAWMLLQLLRIGVIRHKKAGSGGVDLELQESSIVALVAD